MLPYEKLAQRLAAVSCCPKTLASQQGSSPCDISPSGLQTSRPSHALSKLDLRWVAVLFAGDKSSRTQGPPYTALPLQNFSSSAPKTGQCLAAASLFLLHSFDHSSGDSGGDGSDAGSQQPSMATSSHLFQRPHSGTIRDFATSQAPGHYLLSAKDEAALTSFLYNRTVTGDSGAAAGEI